MAKRENPRLIQLRDAVLKTPGGLTMRKNRSMPMPKMAPMPPINKMKANMKRKMVA